MRAVLRVPQRRQTICSIRIIAGKAKVYNLFALFSMFYIYFVEKNSAEKSAEFSLRHAVLFGCDIQHAFFFRDGSALCADDLGQLGGGDVVVLGRAEHLHLHGCTVH